MRLGITMNASPSSTPSPSSDDAPPIPIPLSVVEAALDEEGERREAQIVIRRPGRYFLDRHLKGIRGRHGIKVEADGVTIDLRGHTVCGCEFSLVGILVAEAVCRVRVCNGSVRGWGGVGVDLSGAIRAELDNVKVFDNRSGALRLGAGAVLTDCIVGGDIQTGAASFALAS
jgi:hypothetical protein